MLRYFDLKFLSLIKLCLWCRFAGFAITWRTFNSLGRILSLKIGKSLGIALVRKKKLNGLSFFRDASGSKLSTQKHIFLCVHRMADCNTSYLLKICLHKQKNWLNRAGSYNSMLLLEHLFNNALILTSASRERFNV